MFKYTQYENLVMTFKLKVFKKWFIQSVRANNTLKSVSQEESGLKNFNDIPGPKCYPVIGTLHKYFPFIGKVEQNE